MATALPIVWGAPNKWSNANCISWAKTLNLPSNKFVDGLKTFAITGEVLIALDDTDLEVDIGVTSSIERKKIVIAIKHLTKSSSSTDDSSSSAAEEILQRLKDKEAKDLLAKESKQCECGTHPIALSITEEGYFAIILFKSIACGAYKLICNYGGHGLVLSLIFFVLPLCILGFKCRYICPILFVLLLFFIYDYVNTISK